MMLKKCWIRKANGLLEPATLLGLYYAPVDNHNAFVETEDGEINTFGITEITLKAPKPQQLQLAPPPKPEPFFPLPAPDPAVVPACAPMTHRQARLLSLENARLSGFNQTEVAELVGLERNCLSGMLHGRGLGLDDREYLLDTFLMKEGYWPTNGPLQPAPIRKKKKAKANA